MQPILSSLATPEVVGGLLMVQVLMFLLILVLFTQLGRTRKSIKRLFTGTSGENLESGLHRLLDQVEECKSRQADQQFALNRLTQRMTGMCGNVAIIRYNAFGEAGSDLSFSLAILDDQQNGVVVTSIYGREESRLYAKPVENGKSVYNLSEEEMSAIKKAMAKIG